MHDTPSSVLSLVSGGLGVCWSDQEVPFHTPAKARLFSVPERPPTATQALAETQDTPLNGPPFGGFGTCWIDQEMPFHASATGMERLAGLKVSPTARQDVAEVQDTPTSSVCRAPGGLGVCRTDQVVARAECAGAAATVGGLASPADGTVAAPAAGTAPAANASTAPAIPAVRPAAGKAGLRAGSRPLLSDPPWLII